LRLHCERNRAGINRQKVSECVNLLVERACDLVHNLADVFADRGDASPGKPDRCLKRLDLILRSMAGRHAATREETRQKGNAAMAMQVPSSRSGSVRCRAV
jgi:hypothetical protein